MNHQLDRLYYCAIDRVFAAFCDPDLQAAKFREQGARQIQITHLESSDQHLKMSVSRQMPAEAPRMLKKFISAWNLLAHQEHWQGNFEEGFSGHFKVSFDHVPVSLSGTMHLHPDGPHTRHAITLQGSSKVPLLGRKLADFVSQKACDSIRVEFDYWSVELS